jgi:light-regulated signal transduction histidine kinase (bacteriophytochrome)
VILFVDQGREEVGIRAARLGADNLLVKNPSGYLELPLTILAAIEKSRAQPEPPQRLEMDFQQLAAMAAHELQEPLRMVERYTRILAEDYKGKLDREADQFLGFAHDGARRLQSLIDDLLLLSRLDGPGKPFQRVDSRDLLQRALAYLGPSIEEAGAVITYGSLPVIEADPGQVIQLLRNLLSNALKFRGDSPPRIHLSAARQGEEWLFALQDNGVGLAAEDAEAIFTLFTRLRPELPGSGMGLTICRKILERHGGRIWVESQPGRGSTFFFTLPRTEPAEVNSP